VIGFVLHLPQVQLITSTTVTVLLIFAGLATTSYGKARQKDTEQ
jgi:hypothetical protein